MHTEIVIKGTINEPLFRASDIGEILEISNIRSSIHAFDNTERRVDTMDTSTGTKQVTFLTKKDRFANWQSKQPQLKLKPITRFLLHLN